MKYMKGFNFSSHKVGILSMLLMLAAAALGVDSAFAMAVDPVVPSPDGNPSDNMGEYDQSTNPGGRPADEIPHEDLTGKLKTQMMNKAATATDVRDAGLEAEDYDPEVVLFNKHKYTSYAMLLSKVKPIKVNSYVVEHFRVGQPNIDALAVAPITLTVDSKGEATIDVNKLDNAEALTEYSTVIVEGVEGFAKDAGGNEYSDGALQLFVLDHHDNSDKVKVRVINPPASGSVSIEQNTRFLVCATAGAESQMRVAPVTFLPEKTPVTLQKKIITTIITDAFKEQSKKTPLGMGDVIKYATDIFKKECARTMWLGKAGRIDVKVKETGNREADYMEEGILRQISMMYTHGEELTADDLMAISSMMFTEWAQSDSATAFVGKNEMKRIMKLINSATHIKDASTVEVNNYGIKVRKYSDNFGEIEFVFDQSLTDLGYSDAMVVLDLSSMVRYYMREDKVQTQDMKKSGEAREAEVWNMSRIDCFCLKGGNALIACPNKFAGNVAKLGGITSQFKSTTALASEADKTLKYYIATKDSTGFEVGTLVEWDKDLGDWVQFEGRVFV